MTRRTWSDIRRDLAPFVGARCEQHQRMYMAEAPSAIAALARLRGGARRTPGELPELLEYTTPDPELFGVQHGEAPTHVEWAVHLSLAMFATHQQSHRDRPMHKAGNGFGTAVGHLAHAGSSETAVRRRFSAAATAIDMTELSEHVYGLIGRLRQHAIALDYGRLASDLFAWQTPEAAIGVRRVWGRDLQTTLHRLRRKETETREDAS